MKKNYYFLLLLALLISATITGTLSGRINRTLEEELTSDKSLGEGSALTAVTLLERGQFGDDQRGYFGLLPRGPIYPLFLAASFFIFGKNIYAAWLLNTIFFVGALIFLYKISRKLLPGHFAKLPPLLLAIYWGATINIFIIQTETLALLLITSFVWLIFIYIDKEKISYLLLAAILFGSLILTKPILLYGLPFIAVILWYQHRQRMPSSKLITHILVFLIISYGLAAGWQIRNYLVIGSPELGRGGHIFLTRAKSAEFEGDKLKGFIMSALVGNYMTDIFYTGYAQNPEPRTTVRNILHRWYGSGHIPENEIEINRQFWQEGIVIAKEHPLQFFLVTPVWIMRFNNPQGINLNDFDPLFVGTHPEISHFQKVAIILGTRLLWYAALIFILIAFIKRRREKENNEYWLWLFFFILYFNIIHALFTFAHHRYVLPVVPFYFVFVSYLLSKIRGYNHGSWIRERIS